MNPTETIRKMMGWCQNAAILNCYRHPKFRDILIALSLFAFAFFIRLYGGVWDTQVANAAYMSRQAEYIYSYGHPAVPDPFSSAPLYQPGMAYLLAFTGKLFDIIPTKFGMSSMTLAEGVLPPFLGAATVVVIFWLGSRLYNWKTGLLSGVFASVSFFSLIRTMKGFTFHDALSLFLITLTIALVVRALDILQDPLPEKKKEKIVYLFWILLPAISVGLSGFSWGGYFVIHTILILYILLITLHYFATKKLYPFSSFLTLIIFTLILGTILSSILYPIRNMEEITRAYKIEPGSASYYDNTNPYFLDSPGDTTGHHISEDTYKAIQYLRNKETGKVLAWWDFELEIKAACQAGNRVHKNERSGNRCSLFCPGPAHEQDKRGQEDTTANTNGSG
jgi:asparagine N-glycosylation enzyme membrane subunit Stt3